MALDDDDEEDEEDKVTKEDVKRMMMDDLELEENIKELEVFKHKKISGSKSSN